MKKRNIGLCILFSIITCGIYAIYWFVVLTNELKDLSGDSETASGGVAFLLSIITCNIYGWYWAYKRGENVDTARSKRSIPSSNSGILYLILVLIGFGIIAYALMQNEINKMIEA